MQSQSPSAKRRDAIKNILAGLRLKPSHNGLDGRAREREAFLSNPQNGVVKAISEQFKYLSDETTCDDGCRRL